MITETTLSLKISKRARSSELELDRFGCLGRVYSTRGARRDEIVSARVFKHFQERVRFEHKGRRGSVLRSLMCSTTRCSERLFCW